MSLMDALIKRRSYRKFKAQQISDSQLEQILAAGKQSPTGYNLQKLRFTVVQKADVLDACQKAIIEAFASMDTPDKDDPFYHPITMSKKNQYPCMYAPPTYIIVSHLRSEPNAYAESGAAIQTMMLMASELGLGSCWINQMRWLNDQPLMIDFAKTLGIPEEEMITGAISIGIPDQPAPGEKKITGFPVNIIR